MSEWHTVQLGDLCDADRGITYGIVKVGEYTPDGVPVIRGGDIRENRIVFDDEKRVSPEVSNQFKRTILQGGEIVINLIAEPGHTAVVPLSMTGFNVSRDVAVIPLLSDVNHVFVNYYLKSPEAVLWLQARLNGSVTQKINLGVLREIPVPIPPRSYQDTIAETLGALDDKIAVNDQIAHECAEVGVGQIQTAVRFLHAAAGVLARAAGRFAQLLDHQTAQIVVIGFRKQRVDAGIAIEAGEKQVDDLGDSRCATEFTIERGRAGACRCNRFFGGSGAPEQHQQYQGKDRELHGFLPAEWN